MRALLDVYCDGASSSNPGPAGAGVVILYPTYIQVAARPLGNAGCAVAEFKAAALGLQLARVLPRQRVRVFTDSALVRDVMEGRYAHRKLSRLTSLVEKRVGGRDVQFMHIPGHSGCVYNEMADVLAQFACFGGSVEDSLQYGRITLR